jgi:hypothetical protein
MDVETSTCISSMMHPTVLNPHRRKHRLRKTLEHKIKVLVLQDEFTRHTSTEK